MSVGGFLQVLQALRFPPPINWRHHITEILLKVPLNTSNPNPIIHKNISTVFDTFSGQTKHYKIGIHYFYAKHTALWSNNKDWISQNQDNKSMWSDTSSCELLFLWANTIKHTAQCVGKVQNRHDHHHLIKK